MKNLIRIFLILTIIGGAVSLHSACSDENDCSLAGRPMMYCTIYTINPDNPTIALKDTLDSLTITALGTDSIILNNEKNVHTLMLPLRYTSDTTVFIFRYDPKRREKDFDTLYIVQQNTPYFQSMECGYMMKQNIISAKFGKPGRPLLRYILKQLNFQFLRKMQMAMLLRRKKITGNWLQEYGKMLIRTGITAKARKS